MNRPSSGDRRRVNGGDRSERRPPSSSGNANQVPQNPHESVAPALGPPSPCRQDSRRELPPRPPRERTPLPLSEPEARSPGSSLRQSRRLAGAPVHRWPTSRRGLRGCLVRAPTPFTRPCPRHHGVGAGVSADALGRWDKPAWGPRRAGLGGLRLCETPSRTPSPPRCTRLPPELDPPRRGAALCKTGV